MDEALLAINWWDGSIYENILKLCWNSSFPFSINSSSFYPFFSPTGVNDRHTVVILTSSSLPSTWRSSPLPPLPSNCHFCPPGCRSKCQLMHLMLSSWWQRRFPGHWPGEAAGTSLHAILGPARTPGLPAGASPLHWHIEKTQWQKDKKTKTNANTKTETKKKTKEFLILFTECDFGPRRTSDMLANLRLPLTHQDLNKHMKKKFWRLWA